MILVLLGTQNKSFIRLLKAVEKEIYKGNIKDEVLVQAGYTKYESDKMKIFDFISNEEEIKLSAKADLIITHGGVGSIMEGLQNHKKIIACPRLKKYDEHHNDHQLQIIDSFSKLGYILPLKDLNKFDKVLEQAKTFKPKQFVSNTNNMIKLIEDYIDRL